MAHPTKVRLEEVQPNPLNPRYDYDDPETEELAETISQVGQLQPALVVARTQFLQAYPDQQDKLGPEPWVVLVGNRRLAASRRAGRAALDVRVASELETADEFEDRILIENIQRKDLPPLLEASSLQRRLNRPGATLRSVGAAIGKSHMYVQQRLDLLRMIPEFQELLREGAINIKTGRRLGTRPEEEQRAILAIGAQLIPDLRQLLFEGGITIEAGEGLANHSQGEQRTIFAAGPPYRVEVQQGPAEDGAVNQVSTDEGEAPGPASETDEHRPVNPVSNTELIADSATDGDTSHDSVNPVSNTGPADSTATSATSDGRGSGAEGNGRRTPPASSADLLTTRDSVGRWLETALAELDRALPAGGDGDLGHALVDARRHIEEARAALSRVQPVIQ
jgi:ParB family chromosome partitioning protein